MSVSVDGKPRYVFPRRDCALLPIPNTTVEMLAQMLTERLQGELEKLGAKGLTAIEMEVEENFGQSAVYRVGLTVLTHSSTTHQGGRMWRIVVLGILVGLCLPAVSAAQQAPNGETIYKQHCVGCHEGSVPRAPES